MTSPRRRRISRRGATLLASAAAVLTIVAVGGLFALRVAEGPSALDLAWIDELRENPGPWFELPSRLLDFLGGGWAGVLVIPLALAAAFLVARRPIAALTFVTASAASALVVQAVKLLADRDRPLEALLQLESASFPSGHVANAATMAVLLTLLVRRWSVGIAGAIWVVAMAFARTYLGVHWLTDTLAGAIVGAGVAVFVWALWAPRLQHESRRHPAARGEAPQSGARRGGGAVAQESRRGSG
ncbi:MAG: hypothetical protein CMF56_11980 [Leifsonia sp.]|nr:hypothetical protein [Leifsonia sp.]|tara:strand:+ start:6678 stop:7406 length:729 start_codon:yes stop_codon:yes gene_type:complete